MNKTYFLFFLYLSFLSCKNTPNSHHLIKITAKTILIDSTNTSNAVIDSLITPYKREIIKQINTKLSFAPKNLTRYDGDLQSSLGNLLADLSYTIANPIFKEKTNKTIDFSLFNYGGIRASINQGDVLNKHAFELMPFENSLVVVELTSEKIRELIAYFIKSNKAHPLSKQINLIIENDQYDLKINGKAFENHTTYFVLTSDYLQGGGDNMAFFKDPVSLTPLNYKVREAITTYFKQTPNLVSVIDNRVTRK